MNRLLTDVEVSDLAEHPQVHAAIAAGEGPTPAGVAQLVRPEAAVLGAAQVQARSKQWQDHILGLGPLTSLVRDEKVTDVLVNGLEGVWIDRGVGVEKTSVEFANGADVRRLAVRLADQAGRRLDEACPYVDGRLPGGVRLHAVLPPLVSGAAHVSLRIPQRRRIALPNIAGSLTAVLQEIVHAGVSFVISGGTGSGKTTLLAAMLGEVDAGERIVVVEDTREVNVLHPHVVSLESRTANIEGVGAISMSSLVRQSLRMRPDRLVVGEIRGAEVRDLLTALNTGHEGGCGTVHANTAADVPARFAALGALAGMSSQAVDTQLRSALQVVIQVQRKGQQRFIQEIGVLTASAGQGVVVPAWRAEESPRAHPGCGNVALASGMSLAGGVKQDNGFAVIPADRETQKQFGGFIGPAWEDLQAILQGCR